MRIGLGDGLYSTDFHEADFCCGMKCVGKGKVSVAMGSAKGEETWSRVRASININIQAIDKSSEGSKGVIGRTNVRPILAVTL